MESIKELFKIGRGPSSSHTIGPEVACKYVLVNYPNIKKVKVVLFGSLALTGKGHLTDKVIKECFNGIECKILFNIDEVKKHPNTLEFELFDDQNKLIDKLVVYSIGGGSIEIEGKPPVVKENIYPHHSFQEIRNYCQDNNLSLAEYVYKFEDKDIKKYLKVILDTMFLAIDSGLTKTGELPGNLHVVRKAKQLYESKKDKYSDEMFRKVCSYAYAVSEENASAGVVVTSPTCGASGVLPATLRYYKEKYKISNKRLIDALAVAGIVGVVVKENASISGALAGCQSEIGTACSMAGAALAYLNCQNLEEIEYAAEIGLEHHLGLTCDPINGLVQIPCIERNAVAALRAIDSANLARILNGTRKISFDTIIKTMYETGKDLQSKYRETSMGGLAKNYQPKEANKDE